MNLPSNVYKPGFGLVKLVSIFLLGGIRLGNENRSPTQRGHTPQ
jgi:hypothetical protein